MLHCNFALFRWQFIELATDLFTEAFLNVFKRFISKRRNPTAIYSNNDLNFRGAARELNELMELFKYLNKYCYNNSLDNKS